MNLYEAIFTRKTVRKFHNEVTDPKENAAIQKHFYEISGLFGNIRTEIRIVNEKEKIHNRFPLSRIKAPQYIIFYSEKAVRYQMNAGFLMQHMALYLCTLGLGCCFLDARSLRKDLKQTDSGKEAVGILGFGKSRGTHLRKRGDASRLPLEELCVFKEVPRQWIRQLLEAARQAPSVGNSQPWRFVVYDNRIHIFTKKHQVERFAHYTAEEQNFGGMLANILITAEELWLDVDLIRLENISQKSFPNNHYVLSAIMRS